LIYSILEMVKPLIYHQYMHNLYTIFSKILKICKQFGDNLINEKGNIPRPGVVPKFSDIEVIALNLTSEAMGIDSESNLFIRLSEYKDKMPNLISRRQYNDRRKTTSTLCDTIRKRIAEKIDGGEEYFCIDSKPIEVCRVARGKRCKMGRNDYSKAPSFGYCASQKNYYYGYKLHAICGLSGVIISNMNIMTAAFSEIEDNPLAELNKRIFKSANRFVVNVVYILKDCKCTYFP
jgi:hypothetical protein